MNKWMMGMGLVAGSAALMSCQQKTQVNEERPNILFILSDDHTSQSWGIYGGILQDYVKNDNIKRLAEEGCVLDKSTVTSLLARMAQLGLIVRHPHARDRRAAMTYLTEKGRALAEEVHDICRRSDERALRGIDAQERQTLVRLLRQVSANLEEPV